MFSAQALLINNNRELNKFVDLESHELLNISNEHFPSNLFEKSDLANYSSYEGESPLQLIDQLHSNSSILDQALAAELNRHVDRIGVILNKINALRFSIPEYLNSQDLSKRESIYGAYDLLEQCSDLYEQFADEHKKIVDAIGSVYVNTHTDIYLKARDFHSVTKAILHSFREENRSSCINKIELFRNAFAAYNNEVQKYTDYNKKNYQNYLVTRQEVIYDLLNDFKSGKAIPDKWKLHGEFFFYHNEIAKRYFNTGGPGYVRYLNNQLTEVGSRFVIFNEEPLIFKVIYPQVLHERNYLSRDRRLESPLVPMSLEFAQTRVSSVEKRTDYLRVDLFDFNMLDRDTISVYFDGECVLEDHPLTWEEKTLTIDIVKGKDHTLEIQAKNLGIISPNTTAIRYRLDDNRRSVYKEIYLDKDEKLGFQIRKD